MSRCAASARPAPMSIQRVPLPFLSTMRPNSGANTTVEKGRMVAIMPAACEDTPKRGTSMAPVNFLNATMLL